MEEDRVPLIRGAQQSPLLASKDGWFSSMSVPEMVKWVGIALIVFPVIIITLYLISFSFVDSFLFRGTVVVENMVDESRVRYVGVNKTTPANGLRHDERYFGFETIYQGVDNFNDASKQCSVIYRGDRTNHTSPLRSRRANAISSQIKQYEVYVNGIVQGNTAIGIRTSCGGSVDVNNTVQSCPRLEDIVTFGCDGVYSTVPIFVNGVPISNTTLSEISACPGCDGNISYTQTTVPGFIADGYEPSNPRLAANGNVMNTMVIGGPAIDAQITNTDYYMEWQQNWDNDPTQQNLMAGFPVNTKMALWGPWLFVNNIFTFSGTYVVSDMRYKQNVSHVNRTESCQIVECLQTIQYEYVGQLGVHDPGFRTGFNASQVQQCYPDAVKMTPIGILSVSYPKLIPHYNNVLKSLLERNEHHRREIRALRVENDYLQSNVTLLINLVASLYTKLNLTMTPVSS
jgi:hypothetical protein